jgi:hypothetical protein
MSMYMSEFVCARIAAMSARVFTWCSVYDGECVRVCFEIKRSARALMRILVAAAIVFDLDRAASAMLCIGFSPLPL